MKDDNYVWAIWSNSQSDLIGITTSPESAFTIQQSEGGDSRVTRVARNELAKVFAGGAEHMRIIAH